MPRSRNAAAACCLLACLAAAAAVAAPDPLRPAGTGGVAAVERALARLDQHRRLMIVGAHPDDEDTTLLALVSLAQGGEAAYLSLTRGEGGQNLIGDELGEALGVLRSEELLAARRLDGARQYFTSAYDFGYTPSLEETFARWPREELLVEVVRAIRRFRPQVLVSVFPPDERAGHGQHQASAVLAEEAFRMAGDAAAFPQLAAEGLPPWQPEVLYREAWFDPEAATLELPSGVLDPLTGHTVFQLAMAGRSQHRSQSMGMLQGLESRPVRLTLIAGGPPPAARAWSPPGPGGAGQDAASGGAATAATASPDAAGVATGGPELFSGIATHLGALALRVPAGPAREALAARLARVAETAAEARRTLTPRDLAAAVPPLAAAHRELACALAELRGTPWAATADGAHLAALLAEKLAVAQEGLAAAAGLVLDATVPRAAVVAGTELPVEVTLRNGGAFAAGLVGFEVESRHGWWQPSFDGPAASVASFAPPQPLAPGALVRHSRALAVAGERATVPYFLAAPRERDVYDLSGVPPEWRGEPFEPPPAVVRAEVELYDRGAGCPAAGGCGDPCAVRLSLEREVVALSRDLETGERREPLRQVPAVEVATSPPLLVWPLDRPERRTLTVELVAHGEPRRGRLEVALPAGWPEVPPRPFALQAGERRVEVVELPAPAILAPGRYEVAVAAVEERERPAPPPSPAPGGWLGDEAAVPLAAELPPGPAAQEPAPETAGPTTPPALELRHELAVPLVAYPHVRPRPVPVAARATIAAFPLVLPPLARVGYVRGAADEVPEALAAVGVPVELLAPSALGASDLATYDAIVVGSRAYESAPALATANPALLDYVRRGGLLIVQFQRWEYFQQGLAPLAMTMERRGAGRTTDETAPVRPLVPEHRVLTTPNALDASDWEGWVQERGLYYPQSWDDALMPLLAMADPGASELEGSLLLGDFGEGTYVYTGLAFFRQLPAGVPGAYRLFANLLALAEPQVESEDLPLEELEIGPVSDPAAARR